MLFTLIFIAILLWMVFGLPSILKKTMARDVSKAESDTEWLSFISYRSGQPIKRLFHHAWEATGFAISNKKVNADYDDYIYSGRVPHYVSSWIAKGKRILKNDKS